MLEKDRRIEVVRDYKNGRPIVPELRAHISAAAWYLLQYPERIDGMRKMVDTAKATGMLSVWFGRSTLTTEDWSKLSAFQCLAYQEMCDLTEFDFDPHTGIATATLTAAAEVA